MSVKFAILPEDILQSLAVNLKHDKCSSGLSFLRLPHPRTGLPSLYLPSNDASKSIILEVQAVDPSDERSWFLDDEIVGDGRLIIMTPIDPAFLLLPIIRQAQTEGKFPGRFCPANHIFEEATIKFESSINAADNEKILPGDILSFAALPCTQQALKFVCEFKELDNDLVVYRYSQEKTLNYLRIKVERLSTSQTLQNSHTISRSLAKDGLMEDAKEELLKLGQVQAACDLIGHYLPSDLKSALLLSYNFARLETYLESINEAAALSALPIDAKGKGKPGPAPDSKKRKPNKGSQGVEKLKKVNVNGMAKLSHFFKKA